MSCLLSSHLLRFAFHQDKFHASEPSTEKSITHLVLALQNPLVCYGDKFKNRSPDNVRDLNDSVLFLYQKRKPFFACKPSLL